MTQQEPLAGLALEDIALDGEGRVAITNPAVAERLKVLAAQRRKGKEAPNTNCGLCNSVKGCQQNTGCNSVAGCGSKKAR
jgi:hypothetical protein